MNTQLLHSDDNGIDTAARILRDGGLVAMPTETVYGLAADALNGDAVRHIFEAKGRPMDNPLIVHVADISDIERLGLAAQFPDTARRLAEAFWPGPLTIIMPKGNVIPAQVSAGLDTVAIRLPSHPVARALIARSGCALAAPSANSSGRPSPTTAQHVMDDLSGRIDAVLEGGASAVGVESTVITVCSPVPRILRPGIVTREEIEAVIGPVEVDAAVLNRLEHNEQASSPGMKYKHYSPTARVILVRGENRQFIRFVNRAFCRDASVAALCYDEDADKIDAPCVTLGAEHDQRAQAQHLFDALRQVDSIQGVRTVYAHCPRAQGIGMALYNRLIRAAAFEVIDLPSQRIIGLTGQTGAGKSEVSKHMRESGYTVIDADAAARQAVEDPEILLRLTDVFGDILNPDGTLDRRALASAAFASEKGTRQLNAITHPRIIALMLQQTRQSHGDVVFDAPQLFEAGADVYCDIIIAVCADEDIRRRRLSERDGLSDSEISLRMSAQLSEAYFRAHSDCVIVNNGSHDELIRHTDAMIERFTDGTTI